MVENQDEISESVSSADAPAPEEKTPAGLSFIIFIFGIGAGFLVSAFWADFFGGTLSTVISVFIIALLVLCGLVLVFFVFRRRILDYLFNVTQTQLSNFAEPLADVTRLALKKDAEGATSAARRLVQLSLARYAWISTRRWIMASLTALIAAMAALGGTALLFRQNQLLAVQSDLLRGQNERLAEQNRLIGLDINLAEAARNAELVVEISNIASELGKVVAKVRQQDNLANTPVQSKQVKNFLPIIPDPIRDVDPGLVARIVSASIATRPYRFLKRPENPRNQTERIRAAMLKRPELGMAKKFDAQFNPLVASQTQQSTSKKTDLIERPISPERGQLLAVLINAGIHKTEWFSFNGLDMSYAKMEIDKIPFVSFHQAKLAYADFSYVTIGGSDFGGATLDNAWFRKSIINKTSFATVDADKIPDPFAKNVIPAQTFMTGTDFSGSVITRSHFDGANVTGAIFNDAVLSDVSFKQASLQATTFINTVLIDVDFTGALMHSVDLDGAIVFDKNFLKNLNTKAAPKSFRPDRFIIEPVTTAQVYRYRTAYYHSGAEIDASKIEGRQAYRIKRVGEFAR